MELKILLSFGINSETFEAYRFFFLLLICILYNMYGWRMRDCVCCVSDTKDIEDKLMEPNR